jgi:hypothetical protein
VNKRKQVTPPRGERNFFFFNIMLEHARPGAGGYRLPNKQARGDPCAPLSNLQPTTSRPILPYCVGISGAAARSWRKIRRFVGREIGRFVGIFGSCILRCPRISPLPHHYLCIPPYSVAS